MSPRRMHKSSLSSVDLKRRSRINFDLTCILETHRTNPDHLEDRDSAIRAASSVMWTRLATEKSAIRRLGMHQFLKDAGSDRLFSVQSDVISRRCEATENSVSLSVNVSPQLS